MLTCAATRRRLEALHDGELPIADQIRVNAHLEWCETCAARLDELDVMRSALRTGAPDRLMLSHDEESGLRSSIVSRVKAEEAVSLGAVLRDAFQDLHVASAALGAAVAAAVCLVITTGMMRVALGDQPVPVAPPLTEMGMLPGSNKNPMPMGGAAQMPRARGERLSAKVGLDGVDAMLALAAVVTREGRIASVEVLRSHGTPWIAPGGDEAALVNEMLRAAAEAHFQPATSIAGLPVAVNMVWIVARTTVRATELPAVPSAPRRRSA